jgi:hypothetical protein
MRTLIQQMHPKTKARHTVPKYLFLIFIIGLSACTSNNEHQVQHQRVVKAQTSLQEEQTYLQTLRDSLPTKIQQNIKIGIPPEKAESVEQALIKMQETVVKVAENNLHVQTSFLDSLGKYRP